MDTKDLEKYGLIPKRAAFVREYLIDLNGKQAAIRAGYSPKSADVQASCLLANPKVALAVQELKEERAEQAGVDARWVLDNLIEVSQRCMQKVPVMTFDPIEKAMVQVQDGEGRDVWQFDSKGANQALQLIGKHLGMFTEKIDLNVKHSYEQMKDEDLQAAVSAEMARLGVHVIPRLKEIPHLRIING